MIGSNTKQYIPGQSEQIFISSRFEELINQDEPKIQSDIFEVLKSKRDKLSLNQLYLTYSYSKDEFGIKFLYAYKAGYIQADGKLNLESDSKHYASLFDDVSIMQVPKRDCELFYSGQMTSELLKDRLRKLYNTYIKNVKKQLMTGSNKFGSKVHSLKISTMEMENCGATSEQWEEVVGLYLRFFRYNFKEIFYKTNSFWQRMDILVSPNTTHPQFSDIQKRMLEDVRKKFLYKKTNDVFGLQTHTRSLELLQDFYNIPQKYISEYFSDLLKLEKIEIGQNSKLYFSHLKQLQENYTTGVITEEELVKSLSESLTILTPKAISNLLNSENQELIDFIQEYFLFNVKTFKEKSDSQLKLFFSPINIMKNIENKGKFDLTKYFPDVINSTTSLTLIEKKGTQVNELQLEKFLTSMASIFPNFKYLESYLTEEKFVQSSAETFSEMGVGEFIQVNDNVILVKREK